MDKEDFLMVICGTNDINQNCTGLVQLKYNIQDKLKHITTTIILLSSVPYGFDFPIINWAIKIFHNELEMLTDCLDHVHFLQLSDSI